MTAFNIAVGIACGLCAIFAAERGNPKWVVGWLIVLALLNFGAASNWGSS